MTDRPWEPLRRSPRQTRADEFWESDLYGVEVYEHEGGTQLGIMRTDREPEYDWRVLQQIKNEVCGREREGIQLYPAESRRHDHGNVTHLWVRREGARFNFGFDGRAVASSEIAAAHGAAQRPFQPGLDGLREGDVT